MLSFMFLAFILYFTVLLGIGLWFYKKNQTADEFMLGDRSVNYWVTAIATQASDMGSWLFLGLPAVVFVGGMFQCWTAIGLVIGMFLTWTYVAPKLRAKTAALDSLTLSSYFAHCFHDNKGHIQLVSSCFALIFFTFYIAAGLMGLSVVFNAAFGLPYGTGIVISLCTAAAYTLIGGFVAVAWCDFFQGLFLLVMIVVVPIVALVKIGGVASIIQMAQVRGISLSLLATPGQTAYAIFLAASWGLGYFGQPHILVNFMGIDDPKNIPFARRIGISWQIAVLTASVAIGLVGIGYFVDGLANSELVFIVMTQSIFHPFFAGLVLCAVFAATLSTMDSLILVAGSSIAEDIYKRFLYKRASNNQLLWVSRLGSMVVCLVALTLAWQPNVTIYGLVNYAWSGLGSTFGPLVITSLYAKNVSAPTALAGLVAGALTCALWPLFFSSLPLVPGFLAGFLAIEFGKKFLNS